MQNKKLQNIQIQFPKFIQDRIEEVLNEEDAYVARNGNELTQTSINAVGYMLNEVLNKKELVQDASVFLTLRKEILAQYA